MRERRERELQYFFCCLVIPSSKKIKYCQRERYGAERESYSIFFAASESPAAKNKILSW
jgi:hypothetical protein